LKPWERKRSRAKGKAVHVYKVPSAKRMSTGLAWVLSEAFTLIWWGRDKELDKLELQVLKAVNGEGSIVNILERLALAITACCGIENREVMKRVSLLEGRAIFPGRNLSFHPIIDLLKSWAGIVEDDNGADAFSKLETAVSRVIQDEKHEVLPFVATLMGMKLSGRYAERIKGIEGQALKKLIVRACGICSPRQRN